MPIYFDGGTALNIWPTWCSSNSFTSNNSTTIVWNSWVNITATTSSAASNAVWTYWVDNGNGTATVYNNGNALTLHQPTAEELERSRQASAMATELARKNAEEHQRKQKD